MKGTRFLQSIAHITEVESGQYVSIGEDVIGVDQLESLEYTLSILGASVSDYQVTRQGLNDPYLCKPCLFNDNGVLKLMFSPKVKYKIPTDAMVLEGKSLVLDDEHEAIQIRTLKDAPSIVKYSKMIDYAIKFEGFKKNPKMVEFIQSNGLSEVYLTPIKLIEKRNGQYTFYSGLFSGDIVDEYNMSDEDRANNNTKLNSSIEISLNERVYGVVQAYMARRGSCELCFYLKPYTYQGKEGTTFGVRVP